MIIYLIISFLLWAAFIIIIIKNMLEDLRYLEIEIPNLQKEHIPFHRHDRKNWRPIELYFCGVFLFPIRLIMFFSSFICLTILAKIMGFDRIDSYDIEFPRWKTVLIQ